MIDIDAIEKRAAAARIEPDDWSTFVGPCAHDRDPFTRCTICGELRPGEAKLLTQLLLVDLPAVCADNRRLAAENAKLRERLAKLERYVGDARNFLANLGDAMQSAPHGGVDCHYVAQRLHKQAYLAEQAIALAAHRATKEPTP